MTAAVLKVIGLEFENFLCKRYPWIFTAFYVLFTVLVCLFPGFRQSYFSDIDSVTVMLMNFIAPVVLAVILISTLSAAFGGDREKSVCQIPMTCLIGRKGRSAAKVLAAIFSGVFMCMVISVTAFIIPFFFGLFDGDMIIKYVGTELRINIEWSVWQHLGFSVLCLIIGCILLSFFILFVSCCAGSAIEAVSISSIFMLFEILFNRYSFPAIVREYNIWVFFQPYYFFVMSILDGCPVMNLLFLTVLFLPAVIIEAVHIIKNGT